MIVQARPAVGDPVAWSFPAFEDLALGDLRVLHRHLPRRGLVAVDLRLDAPITVEPDGLEGLALVTARALDEGSTRRDGNEFAAALDRVGAILHAGAGTAGMRMSVDVPAATLREALALLAEAATDPVFPEREVDRLVHQRLDAIRQQHAQPADRITITQREVMVREDHRCALPNGGTLETVEGITRDAAAAFHAEQALTGGATLVLAGNLAGLDVDEVAAELFAPWTHAARPRHDPVALPVRPGPRVVVVDKPGAVQTQLLLARPGPDRRADDWAATRIATYVLGGTLTSRLDAVLREDKGYTYGVRSRLETFRRGGLAQLVSGSVDTEHTGESVRIGLDLIADLAVGGPTDAEVATAIDYLTGVRPLALETPRALVSEVSRNLADDLPAGHTETELAALREVTANTAARAAAAHLRADDCTVIAVGDADAIVGALAALDHADVEVRD